jgi:hypothetical protein
MTEDGREGHGDVRTLLVGLALAASMSCEPGYLVTATGMITSMVADDSSATIGVMENGDPCRNPPGGPEDYCLTRAPDMWSVRPTTVIRLELDTGMKRMGSLTDLRVGAWVGVGASHRPYAEEIIISRYSS